MDVRLAEWPSNDKSSWNQSSWNGWNKVGIDLKGVIET